MANLSIKTGTISRSMLAGNPPFIPTSFESIATATGTGSSRTITFSSIPSTYKHLQLRWIAKDTFGPGFAGAYAISLQFNSDASNIYSCHRMINDPTLSAYAQQNQSAIVNIYGITLTETYLNNIMGAGIIDIHDYSSTTKNKTIKSFTGVNTNSTTVDQTGAASLASGSWRNTNAITSITISSAITAFTTTSQFALYGILG